MPELAEVAIYARDISKITTNKIVKSISFPNRDNWGNLILPKDICKIIKAFKGQSIEVESIGKVLRISNAENNVYSVDFQLGMTGKFHLEKPVGKWKNHCFLEIEFNDFTIQYSDPRRFGRVRESRNILFAIGGFKTDLGFWYPKKIELPPGFLKKSRYNWLISHGYETGVGNYMANEALGRLNLSPFESFKDYKEALKTLKLCYRIARASFNAGGNSFGSGYFDLHGNKGTYLKKCKFYQNQNVNRYHHNGRPVFTNF